MSEAEEPIWESTLDNRWKIVVQRTADYKGEFTITDTESGEVVKREAVGLMYGAAFGPDVDDVAEWQEMAVRYVDVERPK